VDNHHLQAGSKALQSTKETEKEKEKKIENVKASNWRYRWMYCACIFCLGTDVGA
jgi:hypothetical protein